MKRNSQLDTIVFQCKANPKHKEFDFNMEHSPKYRKCFICGARSYPITEGIKEK